MDALSADQLLISCNSRVGTSGALHSIRASERSAGSLPHHAAATGSEQTQQSSEHWCNHVTKTPQFYGIKIYTASGILIVLVQTHHIMSVCVLSHGTTVVCVLTGAAVSATPSRQAATRVRCDTHAAAAHAAARTFSYTQNTNRNTSVFVQHIENESVKMKVFAKIRSLHEKARICCVLLLVDGRA